MANLEPFRWNPHRKTTRRAARHAQAQAWPPQGRHREKSTLYGGLFLSPNKKQITTKNMANYYATARSNYFAVNDETAFREWAAKIGLHILEPTHRDQVTDGILRFGITPNDGDDSGWPNLLYNAETDDYDEIDLPGQLSAHLADDEVAILMEVGNEKLRYVSGSAVAVNNQGKSVFLNLETIYQKARRLGKNITLAEY